MIDPFAGPAAAPAPADAASPAAPLGTRLLTMIYAPSNPSMAYIGSDGSGVYRSQDGGEHWTSAGLSGQVVWSLAVDPLDPLHLYAATSQAGAVKTSSNGGASWSDLSLPGETIYSLALAGGGMLYAAAGRGVYRYDGAAWQPAGLSGTPAGLIAVDPVNPARLYAAGATGAYYSIDAGLAWQPVLSELQGIAVQSIQFNPAEPGVVYFGTKTHGVLRVDATALRP